MDVLAPYVERINDLCKKYKVQSLHVFGSAVKGGLRPDSDIDFVVDIPEEDPHEYGERYFGLLFALEDLLKRPIDLLEKRALRNKYFIQELNAHKRLLYGS